MQKNVALSSRQQQKGIIKIFPTLQKRQEQTKRLKNGLDKSDNK